MFNDVFWYPSTYHYAFVVKRFMNQRPLAHAKLNHRVLLTLRLNRVPVQPHPTKHDVGSSVRGCP